MTQYLAIEIELHARDVLLAGASGPNRGGGGGNLRGRGGMRSRCEQECTQHPAQADGRLGTWVNHADKGILAGKRSRRRWQHRKECRTSDGTAAFPRHTHRRTTASQSSAPGAVSVAPAPPRILPAGLGAPPSRGLNQLSANSPLAFVRSSDTAPPCGRKTR